MARPKAKEQRDTRAEIVAAALDLFAEKGFHGTSVRDIARAVGVRESALYNHFENKDAIFEQVLFAPDANDHPMLGPPRFPTFDGGADELPAFLEQLLAEVADRFDGDAQRKRFRIMLTDGIRLAQAGELDPFSRIFPLRLSALELLQSLIARGLLRGDRPEQLLISFLAPVFVWRVFDAAAPDALPRPDRRPFIAAHVRTFLQGCAGEAR
ncbi:MAG: TetR/AcrR family transcriptional regulator [Deltaproteobacteria bacterium]|nr:TetR/AcrR family transcriptional regulator [Deltaproteobacteria bacterium]